MYVQDGPTIEGVLAGKTRSTYVLWAPKLILPPDENEPDRDPEVEVSGHVEIPRERVLWFQVVG